MGFKRISFGQGEIFDIVVTDESGQKVGRWKVMKQDLPDAIRIINDKFGLNLSIKNKEENKDLDWAL